MDITASRLATADTPQMNQMIDATVTSRATLANAKIGETTIASPPRTAVALRVLQPLW